MLADAGYGINTAFRTALTRMGLTYVVGIQSSARFWPPGGVAGMARRAAVDRRRATIGILGHMRRRVHQTHFIDEVPVS